MSRRGNIAKRDVLADPLYNSKMVTRLINNIMYDGKKGVAQKIVYDAFDIVKEKTGNDPLESFEKALENIMPVLEVKARRVGGSTYQVPMEVRPERRETLGLRWLTTYARARSERTMRERLAGEIMDAVNGNGNALGGRVRFPYRKAQDSSGTHTAFPKSLGGNYAKRRFSGNDQKHRHYGPYRRRQDHDHRAHPVLYRHQPQNR